jgi:phosphate-selective porin OprO/OprP
MNVTRIAVAGLLWLGGGPTVAQHEPAAATAAESLEQRLLILERQLEIEPEQEAEAAETRPVVAAGKEGFALRSADGAFALKLRGYLQLDGRFYAADDARRAVDTFVIRRARPIVEGTLWRVFDFRIMPDFGGGTSALLDGYVEGRFSKAVRVRAGKFKPPLGLERLRSATDLDFVERSAPTSLAPSRDVGVQVGGELLDGRLEYQIGAFNGAVDGGTADGATSDGKDFAARLFWRPFRNADGTPPELDLGLGLALSRGDQSGTPSAPQLPAFRTAGNQTFFSYRSDGAAAGTAVADGQRTRILPQGWLYVGRFGALVEYSRSAQWVRRDAVARELENEAWQAQVSWVLTGERNSFRGVEPHHPWGPTGRGAWSLAARYAVLNVDPAAFPHFADAARSASAARLASLGVSWHLARGVRWMLDAGITQFDGGAAAGADRSDEKALLTRFQVSF